MFATKILLLLLVAVVGYTDAAENKKLKCTKVDHDAADDAVSLLFTLGRKDRKFPTTTDEMKSYCKDHRKYLLKVEEYKDNCLKETPKQLISVIVYSIRTVVNNYCKSTKVKRVKDVINAGKCVNNNAEGFNKCNTDVIQLYQNVAEIDASKRKEKLEQFCCGYVKGLQCLHDVGTASKCEDQAVEATVDFARAYFDGAVNTICGEYTEHTDLCEKIPKLTLKKFKNPPKSLMHPIVDILQHV